MSRLGVQSDYFDWMCDLVCKDRFADNNSYRKLLSYLHNIEFRYRIQNDSDRACDGVHLRHRYALYCDEYDYNYIQECLSGEPCTVLEMMVALAIRCEETIMDDPSFGDRTGQWFWRMIVNLGLGSMTDNRFDRAYVTEVLVDFLNREYEPSGRGGLFTVRNCDRDFRMMPIWNQMMLYLDTMI